MFKITIEETKVEDVHIGKEWRLVGKQADAVYAYTPETDTQQHVTRTIYEQTVDVLDIQAAILVINGMLHLDAVSCAVSAEKREEV